MKRKKELTLAQQIGLAIGMIALIVLAALAVAASGFVAWWWLA